MVGVGSGRKARADEERERRQPLLGAVRHGDLPGRRRPRALHPEAGPGQRHRRRGDRRAEGALRQALGGDGDHRTGGRLGLGAIRTTAVREGDEYVLNGEKIFVTGGERAELVVVWATPDRSLGKPAIKSFVVERSNPGLKLVRLEHKLGIRASERPPSTSTTAESFLG